GTKGEESTVLAQYPEQLIGIEALTDEVSIQPLELPIVGNPLAAVQPLQQRGFKERRIIDARTHVVDGALRGRARNPGALDLSPHAEFAALLERRLSPRDRLVDVARPAQRFFVGDQALRVQPENRLIERLHPVL